MYLTNFLDIKKFRSGMNLNFCVTRNKPLILGNLLDPDLNPVPNQNEKCYSDPNATLP